MTQSLTFSHHGRQVLRMRRILTVFLLGVGGMWLALEFAHHPSPLEGIDARQSTGMDGALAQVRLNVNVADAQALAALPSVGPVLARRIVAERGANGAFGSVEGLLRVKGVGPHTLDKLRPFVTSR